MPRSTPSCTGSSNAWRARSESLEALKLESTASILAARLREAIADGRFKPGEAIRQEVVSAEFGVSRSPLREALRQLEADGLIDYRPNYGATVLRVDPVDVEEIYEIRRALQLAALQLAIPHITPVIVRELAAIVYRMNQAKSPRAWLQLHWKFHELLYGASGRRRLVQLIRVHHIRFDAFPKRGERFERLVKFSRPDLLQLLRALQEKDLRNARRLTLVHLSNLKQSFLDALRK
ncbi:MAG: GntR family transcriptional regulator [Candidatus Eremiobacteraeota bacterium]|nr:GntR family transcriptional regulator [Candidatus Eremiobacteraeota bacterium]